MTTEEAISIIERVEHTESKWPGTEDTLDALDMAISALRAQHKFESNQPLTMDELRQMDGEPVWCEIRIKGKPPFYGIVHGENVTGFVPGDDKPVNLAITHVGAYGLAWLAYRHKPEEA